MISTSIKNSSSFIIAPLEDMMLAETSALSDGAEN
jgi:hypothetical protein